MGPGGGEGRQLGTPSGPELRHLANRNWKEEKQPGKKPPETKAPAVPRPTFLTACPFSRRAPQEAQGPRSSRPASPLLPQSVAVRLSKFYDFAFEVISYKTLTDLFSSGPDTLAIVTHIRNRPYTAVKCNHLKLLHLTSKWTKHFIF